MARRTVVEPFLLAAERLLRCAMTELMKIENSHLKTIIYNLEE